MPYKMFQNMTPPASQAQKPQPVVTIGPDIERAKAMALAHRQNQLQFRPTGYDNLSGPGFMVQGLAEVLTKNHERNQAAAKAEGLKQSLIDTGNYSPAEATAMTSGNSVIAQALGQAKNMRERVAMEKAAQLELLKEKKRLGLGAYQPKQPSLTEPKEVVNDAGEVIGYSSMNRNAKRGPNGEILGEHVFTPVKPDNLSGGRVLSKAEIEGAKARSRERNKEQGKAEMLVSGVQDQATRVKTMINEMINGPDWENFVGVIDGNLPLTSAQGKDFQARLDQLGGVAFLQAFQELKGGGQITEIEGVKATQAIMRMRRATSEADFLAAARDLQETADRAVRRMRALAGDFNAIDDIKKEYEATKEQDAKWAEWKKLYNRDREAAAAAFFKDRNYRRFKDKKDSEDPDERGSRQKSLMEKHGIQIVE